MNNKAVKAKENVPVSVPNVTPVKNSGVKTISSQNKRISPNLQKGVHFKKGQSGNPGGRPKTKDIREFMLNWLEVKNGTKTEKLLLVERLSKQKPEIILYYAYGKPEETLSLQNSDGSNLIPNEFIEAAAKIAKTL